MKTYVIMSAKSIPGLMEIVNQAMAGGWEMTGNMVIEYCLAVEGESETQTWYHQAMLRPPEVKAPCPSCGARELHTRDCPHDGNG
jgi:hypothetical protein